MSNSSELPPEVRHERKFFAPGWSVDRALQAAKSMPGLVREVHHPRCVRSVYFDTPGLKDFWANADGLPDRRKVRLRGYGEEPLDRLEIKKRHGDLIEKRVLRLPDHSPSDPVVREILGSRHPSVFVEYWRRYFLGWNGRVRMTLDWDLRYAAVRRPRGKSQRGPFEYFRRVAGATGIVLEVKYPPEFEALAARSCQGLPLRLSRHSKYVLAIKATGVAAFSALA